MKYLTLIRAIALLHQYQREVKTVNHNGEALSYIEVMKSDIEVANKLAHDVLGRSLDELPPQTRTLLKHVHKMVEQQCKAESIEPDQYRFSRRDVREYIGWTDFQIKKHMSRLQEMEYVLIHRGGRGQSFVYELLYQGEGDNGDSFLLGLSSMDNLTYDDQKKPLNENNEPPSRPQGAGNKPQGSTSKKAIKLDVATDTKNSEKKVAKSAVPLTNGSASHHSYAS